LKFQASDEALQKRVERLLVPERKKFHASDEELQKRVEQIVVHEGKSAREATRTIGCDRETVTKILSMLGIAASTRKNASRDALIRDSAAKGISRAAIAREAGITRRAVRRTLDGSDNARRGLPRSLAEQDALALAALRAAYPGERYRDVPDDHEVERWSPPRARIDDGPAERRSYEPWQPTRPPLVPRLVEAERSEEEEIVEEIISLHENDELSARHIANLIGLDTKEVKRVLAERAEQLAASAA
jgi:hypothetical protein